MATSCSRPRSRHWPAICRRRRRPSRYRRSPERGRRRRRRRRGTRWPARRAPSRRAGGGSPRPRGRRGVGAAPAVGEVEQPAADHQRAEPSVHARQLAALGGVRWKVSSGTAVRTSTSPESYQSNSEPGESSVRATNPSSDIDAEDTTLPMTASDPRGPGARTQLRPAGFSELIAGRLGAVASAAAVSGGTGDAGIPVRRRLTQARGGSVAGGLRAGSPRRALERRRRHTSGAPGRRVCQGLAVRLHCMHFPRGQGSDLPKLSYPLPSVGVCSRRWGTGWR